MRKRSSLIILAALGLACGGTPPLAAASLADRAREVKADLAARVLPYWFDTAQDTVNGGYLLSDDLVKGRTPPKEKAVVTQARMVWTFSLAHRKGFSDAKRDYLKAAAQGYRFLLEHFLDRENGGYFWKTDLAGQPVKPHKFVYGQSFVIYALVEYHRASGDPAALRHAMDLYRALHRHAHDPQRGGWVEHFTRDWTSLPLRDPASEIEVAGLKSANTHLHLMEAFAELYEVTRDADVRRSLEESLRLNMDFFYPADAAQSCFHRNPDWSVVTDPRSAGLSYGHNVEFAWLMVRAERVLGRPPSWRHFAAHLDHALECGFDHVRGGLYNRGAGREPASDTAKVWWVQSELIAACTDALLHQPNSAYEAALTKTLDFVARHMTDPKDGIWIGTVLADGRPQNTSKANNWKANYHDVRALVKFVEAFGGK